ncbi:piggyBac transposable element-derived protein 4-like [Bemisia tabaci]|uniref:piggyBac transposable element-derived protein 4-like n=1 Tax=Bemisia tabaci TaxID=7038 RepID=UPI003B27D160
MVHKIHFTHPIFSQLMSRNRFLAIVRFLHFSSNLDQTNGDRMFKIRSVLDYIRAKFKALYKPGQNICIDESLLLFKGRLSFKQYIKTKRARWGIKFYKLCDSLSGYIVDFLLYLGSKTEYTDNYKAGKSGCVVMTLMQPYLGKGYNLFTDNFYTSPTLCQILRFKNTNLCGTVKSNRQGMPRFVVKQKKLRNSSGKKPPKVVKLERGEMQERHTENMMVVRYMDKREVLMLTSMDQFDSTLVQKKNRQDQFKPSCVVNYNKNMGAVDKTDMLLSSIESARKTIKWYKKVFFHLMDLSVLNAHVLYKTVTKKKISLHNFRLNLIEQLIEEHKVANLTPKGGRKSSEMPTRLIDRHFPSQIPPNPKKQAPTRVCHVCSNSLLHPRKRKESRIECSDCGVALCMVPCFKEYHTLKKF